MSIGFLTERLTSLSAILICCLLGAMKPQKWHLIGFAMIAALFFFVLYNDTAAINRMEAQLDRKRQARSRREVGLSPPSCHCLGACLHIISSTAPASAAVLATTTLSLPRDNFVSGQTQEIRSFMADMQSAGGAQVGDYVVRARDLPLSDIYQCDSSMTELCVRDLAVGDRTSSALRDSNWFWRYNATSLLVDVSLGPVMFVVVYAGRRLTAWRQPARS